MYAFNPRNPKYKTVANLPEEQRVNFIAVEDGFITKEAHSTLKQAAIAADWGNEDAEKRRSLLDIILGKNKSSYTAICSLYWQASNENDKIEIAKQEKERVRMEILSEEGLTEEEMIDSRLKKIIGNIQPRKRIEYDTFDDCKLVYLWFRDGGKTEGSKAEAQKVTDLIDRDKGCKKCSKSGGGYTGQVNYYMFSNGMTLAIKNLYHLYAVYFKDANYPDEKDTVEYDIRMRIPELQKEIEILQAELSGLEDFMIK